jgi:hypothetical protein
LSWGRLGGVPLRRRAGEAAANVVIAVWFRKSYAFLGAATNPLILKLACDVRIGGWTSL